ncbi:TetR family transcriptional regulator [Actinophytocola sp.]|jgi:AcrR family transcriptional regulator|uniref:TetR/AcrR family transcriptional regulator n=1 Tax=Actinophytocola sp. TaxID=1872138 RepID=UPI002EDA5B5A
MGTDPSGAGAPDASGAGQTRDAILRAARRRFAQRGFAEVGLRDIALDCGVSAALVVKYFGTKENLFAEAVSFETEATALLDCALPGLGEHLVRTLLDLHERAHSDPFLRAVLAAFRPNGAEFSASFQRYFVQPLAARLACADAQLRADLICAQLIGLGAVRLAINLPGVSALTAEQVVAHYGPLLQGLVDA